jgi:hypothetical protein
MKKGIFLIFTILSLVSYTFSGLLLGIHFTEESPGMIMIFLIPLLITGLLSGIIAFFIKKTQKLELKQFSVWLHYLNLILILLGIIVLIYTFYE